MGIPTLPIPKETGPNLIVFTYGSVMQIYAIIVSTGFLSTIFPFFLMQESAFVVEMARVELKVFADSHNNVISSVRGRLNISFHFTRGLSYFLFVTVVTQSQQLSVMFPFDLESKSLLDFFKAFYLFDSRTKTTSTVVVYPDQAMFPPVVARIEIPVPLPTAE